MPSISFRLLITPAQVGQGRECDYRLAAMDVEGVTDAQGIALLDLAPLTDAAANVLQLENNLLTGILVVA